MHSDEYGTRTQQMPWWQPWLDEPKLRVSKDDAIVARG